MDDGRGPFGQLMTAALRETEAGCAEVGRHRLDPSGIAASGGAERVMQKGVDPLPRGVIGRGANERDDRPVGALELAQQNFGAEEAGRSAQQQRSGHRPTSDRYAQATRARVSGGAISSSMWPLRAATSGVSCSLA